MKWWCWCGCSEQWCCVGCPYRCLLLLPHPGGSMRSVHPLTYTVYEGDLFTPETYTVYEVYMFTLEIYIWRRSVHPCNIFMKEICSSLQYIYEGDLFTPETYLWRRSVHPCNIFKKEICSPLKHILLGDLFTRTPYITTVPKGDHP